MTVLVGAQAQQKRIELKKKGKKKLTPTACQQSAQ